MIARTFTVMEPLNRERGSYLRFRGNWLQAAGFEPGQKLTLTVMSPGVIELHMVTPERQDAAYSAATQKLDLALNERA